MNFQVDWRHPEHFLIDDPFAELTVDGVEVPLTKTSTGFEGIVPPPSGENPRTAVLLIKLRPASSSATVLHVEQTFELKPGGGSPQPTEYTVRRPVGGDTVQKGRHPLLILPSGASASWEVFLLAGVVDITGVEPLLFAGLNFMRTKQPQQASVRILARTDGKRPLHYICATPPACRTAQDTDILCFLTPPQESPEEIDAKEALGDPKKRALLAGRTMNFLGTPRHDEKLPPIARDHFTPGAPGAPAPNLVLLRRWEDALMAASKHVALVLPVPSKGSHNTAATGDLPAQLRQVHAALHALGDITSTTGSPPPGPPRLGVAGHSYAGPELFAAIKSSAKEAFSEIWMFEAMTAPENVATVAGTTVARLLYAGYEHASVVAASKAAEVHPALAGRVRRLPDPAPSPSATPATLATSSPMLTHMLEGGEPPVAKPANTWKAGPVVLPNGEKASERFLALHQLIVQGNDADGDHFLTKALKGSVFR
jgi:hypothetical protein